MPYEELKAIAGSYPPASPGELLEMALERRRRQESDVLELAALASELSVDSIIDLGLEPDLHPHILRAFPTPIPTRSPGVAARQVGRCTAGIRQWSQGQIF